MSGCRSHAVTEFETISDTSCILAWLIEQGYEVYAFFADIGQEEVWITLDYKRRLLTTSQRILRLPARRRWTLARKSSSSRLASPAFVSVADAKLCAGRTSSASSLPSLFIRLFKLMPSTRLAFPKASMRLTDQRFSARMSTFSEPR